MNRHSCALFVAVGLAASWPAEGRAYSDPGTYGKPVLEEDVDGRWGGGDNRYFTGSPADGFSCGVCHSGREGLELSVSALPATYLPGQTYEIVLAWAGPQINVAGNLEITDELGRPMGTLVAPPFGVPLPPDECPPAVFPGPDTPPLPGGRQALVFSACEASKVRWQWTAPPQPSGMAFLSGGVVVADDDGTFAGDGVTVLARTILAPGQEPLDMRASGGCSVMAPTTRHSASGAWLPWLLALGFGLRRFSKRRDR